MKHCTCIFALMAIGLASCADEPDDTNNQKNQTQPITIEFKAQFGDQPFGCDQSYPNIGRGNQMYTPTDARMYVHNVMVITQDDQKVPIALKDDAVFQSQGVVLLDFEDGANNCDNGTLLTNTEIVGTAPKGPYKAIEFTIGIPPELNHANQATAQSPLNLTGLWWSWLDGYKFMKFDGRTETMLIGALFHLGSTQCDDTQQQTTCQNPNTPTIRLDWQEGQPIIFDLAKLFEDAHLDMDEGEDLGCTSGVKDPDCAPIFRNLGLRFGDNATMPQRVFRTP